MSDVQDWTGVSAGATSLVDSGTVDIVHVGGTTFQATVDVTGIPQTTRSLLLLLFCTATGSGGGQSLSVEATGNVTGATWFSGQPILDKSGNTLIGANVAVVPQYFPFYAVVDSVCQLVIGSTDTMTLDYWVLALPDADILGSATNPLCVGNSWMQNLASDANAPLVVEPYQTAVFTVEQLTPADFQATVTPAAGAVFTVEQLTAADLQATVTPAAGAVFTVEQLTAADLQATVTPAAGLAGKAPVLPVILQDGAGNQQGAQAAPLSVTGTEGGSVSVDVSLTTAMQQLVPAPAAGKKRIVECFVVWHATAGDTIGVGVNSNALNFAYDFELGDFLTPRWVILNGGAGIYVENASGARGNAYATYHDEAI